MTLYVVAQNERGVLAALDQMADRTEELVFPEPSKGNAFGFEDEIWEAEIRVTRKVRDARR